MADLLNDPDHRRQRAEEARARAEAFTDASSRQAMLQIALDYEQLARHAENRMRAAEAGLNATARTSRS
jgi:hypothetical protein